MNRKNNTNSSGNLDENTVIESKIISDRIVKNQDAGNHTNIKSEETACSDRERAILGLTSALEKHSIFSEGQRASLTRANVNVMPTKYKTPAQYLDGRRSAGHKPNPRCLKIVMSDRALAQIYSETQDKGNKETGGLLLGHYIDSVWYIIESSDPGYDKSIFRHSYHESDEEYANHVCSILSRIYKHPLNFLGMWHRHPGSMDSFSGTDDATNTKYAKSAGNGCISLLINKDPRFRFTAYYVDLAEDVISYTKTDLDIGDNQIARRDVREIAMQSDIDNRKQ
jgi:hypothetical protein